MADSSTVCMTTDTITTKYLTRDDSIGLTIVAESAFISLIAVLAVFVLLIVSQLTRTRRTISTHPIVRNSAKHFEIVLLNGLQMCTWYAALIPKRSFNCSCSITDIAVCVRSINGSRTCR